MRVEFKTNKPGVKVQSKDIPQGTFFICSGAQEKDVRFPCDSLMLKLNDISKDEPDLYDTCKVWELDLYLNTQSNELYSLDKEKLITGYKPFSATLIVESIQG